MDIFKFEMQRFNDGQPAPQEPVGEPTQQQQNEDDFGVAIDENGDIVFDENFFENPAVPQQEKPTSNMYTPDELKQLPFEKIDPNKLPPELQELYRSMQAPFSRATQQLASQKQQYEEFMRQQQAMNQGVYQQPPQQPQQPQQEGIDRKAYVQKLFTTAKEIVEGDLQETFDELNPVHQAALVDAVTELKQRFYEQQSKAQEVHKVISTFSQDPDWQEVDAYAEWRIKKLPFELAEPLMARIKSGDAAALYSVLSIARDELRAVKKGQQIPQQQPQTKAPFVEQPGTSQREDLQRSPDYSVMRGKKTDDLAKLVQQWGLV